MVMNQAASRSAMGTYVSPDDNVISADYVDDLMDYLTHPPEWMHAARCGGFRGDTEAILRECQECPVIKECEQHANQYGISTGVWGGKLRG